MTPEAIRELRTSTAPAASSQRPTTPEGRHQGFLGLVRRGASSSGSAISTGMPGKERPRAGADCCARRKRGSVGESSSHIRGRVVLFSLITPAGAGRVTRFHYSLVFAGFFPYQRKGESAPLRDQTVEKAGRNFRGSAGHE